MKRFVALMAALTIVGGFALVSTGWANGGPPEEHPHMLLLGLELDGDGNPIGFRKCVDLAAGQALPLNVHHARLHVGRAGEALFTKAGHMVIPGAPLSSYENCAALLAP